MTIRHARDAQRGQALVEMAFVVVLLVTLVMGTIEFGRAWMVSNMITHAARSGARAAAVSPDRSGGTITNTAAIQTQVLNEIGTVVAPAGFAVNVTQPTIGGIPMVSVTVTGAVDYLFGLFGPNFDVARTVTFRDEGR